MTLDNPLLDYLGIRMVEWSDDLAVFEMDIEPHHLNRQASLHGGATATLLDAACGYAGIWSAEGAPIRHSLTLSLNINYLAPIRAGRLRSTGRATGGGRGVYFAEARLESDTGLLIATAQGAFKRSQVPA